MPVIRARRPEDSETVLRIMRRFYDSPAVLIHAPDDVLRRNVAAAAGDCPCLDGWVMEEGEEICGYAMCVRSYSTEAGGECIWLEELCVAESHRGQGIGRAFFAFLHRQYPEAARFRLEAEHENRRALRLYRELGYTELPYLQLIRETGRTNGPREEGIP